MPDALPNMGDSFTELFSDRLRGYTASDIRVFFNDFIRQHYEGEGRTYHNLDHITACITGVNGLKGMKPQLTPNERLAIGAALWFHDVVYDPKRQDNEELSAAALLDFGAKFHVQPDVVKTASNAILATKHNVAPTTLVDKWTVDIDLSIFCASEAVFDEYERRIRREYEFVDDSLWIPGRSRVLQSFLDRDWIYSTPTYRRLFEGDARANLKRSIARLAKGEVLRLVA